MFRIICKDPEDKGSKSETCPTFIKAKEHSKIFRCLKVCFKYRFDQITFCNGKPISYFLKYLKVSLSFLLILSVGILIWWKSYEIKVSFLYSKISLATIF